MRDLIRQIQSAVRPEHALMLATIAAHRTGGDPSAHGNGWSGAFAISDTLWPAPPDDLAAQAEQAEQILADIGKTATVLDRNWRLPDAWEPIREIKQNGEHGDVLKNSARLGRDIEQAATVSMAWDRPVEVRDAIEGIAGPVAYSDVVTLMQSAPAGAWEHQRVADSLVRLYPDMWSKPRPAESGDWSLLKVGMVAAGLGGVGLLAAWLIGNKK